MTAVTIDLTDPDAFIRQEHHGMLAWLRENDPVHWHTYEGEGGFWALTRYDDLLTAYREHATFSSSGGAMLGGSFRSDADTASNRMLVASDPPRQRLLRQQMHPPFAQDSVNKVAAQVTTLVKAAVDKALADGGCDFATDIAPELPAGALMAIMGISHEEALELVNMTRRMIGFRDPRWVDTSDDERLRLAVIQSEILEFFADIARDRRKHPGGDDVISLLLRAKLNGRPLPEADVLYNCMNVAVGGNETSSYTACTGTIALAENPEEWAKLQAEPGLLDSGLNEILRWSSTNAYVQRVAMRDVDFHGRQIRKGDSVTLWNVSANRDERQFPRAHEFHVDRSPNRHLTYGSGIHRCVGAPVAQVELPILYRELLDRRVRFTISGEVVRLRSNFILGVTHLPLAMEAA